MTYSTTLKTLLASTAIAGMTAAPLAAQSVSTEAGVGVSTGVDGDVGVANTSVNAGSTATADSSLSGDVDSDTDGQVTASSDLGVDSDAQVDGDFDNESSLTASADADNDAEGTIRTTVSESDIARASAMVQTGEAVVVSAEETVIGTIDDIETDTDGAVRYTVELEDEFAAENERIVIRSNSALDSDGRLLVNMSDDEFNTALAQQTNAANAARVQTN
jgi:hypothetical protein